MKTIRCRGGPRYWETLLHHTLAGFDNIQVGKIRRRQRTCWCFYLEHAQRQDSQRGRAPQGEKRAWRVKNVLIVIPVRGKVETREACLKARGCVSSLLCRQWTGAVYLHTRGEITFQVHSKRQLFGAKRFSDWNQCPPYCYTASLFVQTAVLGELIISSTLNAEKWVGKRDTSHLRVETGELK